MKRLRLGFLVFLAVFIVVPAATVWLLYTTEAGTHLLIEQAQRFLPVTVSGVSGTLASNLSAGKVEIDLDAGKIEIDELQLAVRLLPLLFNNELHVVHVKARDVRYVSSSVAAPSPSKPVTLRLPDLPIAVRLDELSVDRLRVDDLEMTAVRAAGRWTEDGLELRELAAESSDWSATVRGNVPPGKEPEVSLTFTWALPEFKVRGSGSASGVPVRLMIVHELAGDYQAHASGLLDLAELDNPRFDLDVTAADILVGDVLLEGLKARVHGSFERLVVIAEGGISLEAIEPFLFAVELTGPPTGPAELELRADPLTGEVIANARLDWSTGFEVAVTGWFEGIDLTKLPTPVEGVVSGDIGLDYRADLLEIAVRNLTGELNGRPVDGEVLLVQTSNGWTVRDARVAVGENAFVARGELIGEQMWVVAEIAAPALEQLGLALAGDLSASFEASGRWPTLDGKLVLRSNRLAGFDIEANGVTGQASMTSGAVDVLLNADRLAAQGLEISSFIAKAYGTPAQVTWQLDWAEGNVAGRYEQVEDRQRLSIGALSVVALDHVWTLGQPMTLTFGGESLTATPFCIVGGGARACFDETTYASGALSTAGHLERLPVSLVSPWLPVQARDDGYLEGSWQVVGEGAEWFGQFDLATRGLAVVLPEAEREAIALPDLTLEAKLTGTALRLTIGAEDDKVTLTGEATVAPLDLDGELSGEAAIAAEDLSALRVFDHRIARLAGKLVGSVKLSGTATDPRFEGLLQLIDAQVQLNDPGIALEDLDLDVTLTDTGTFRVSGKVTNLGGEVTIDAEGSGLFDGQIAVVAKVLGNNLRVEHPDWDVVMSPDLVLAFVDNAGLLSGTLEIPRAHVRVNSVPASVPTPSDDVVVVGREEHTTTSASPLAVDVNIVLGEDVSLSAAGIRAELTGALNARLDERGRASLRGKVDVTGGVVTAQGQTLALESGSIVFNGPITNPYVDLRAVRIIDDRTPPIKVGLHIQGTATNLTSSVYSEPPMSDVRALSFLVLGHDLEQGASANNALLLAAAANLGLSQAGSVISELKRFTGLDELSAMADSQQSFAIVAGKRITEDMYVRYIYDTLSAVGALLIRYHLTDRWVLEGRTSTVSSMDILYGIEN